MSRTIVVTSGKGGVGKTTVTANLGLNLTRKRKRVCIIDMDVGLNNLDVVLGLEKNVNYTLLDVLDNKCRLSQALIQDDEYPLLSILTSGNIINNRALKYFELEKVINSLQQKFDYILIDCPAGIDAGFNRAIAFASEAIVVTTPHLSSMRDADKVVSILHSYDIKSIRFVVNRARGDLLKSNIMLDVYDIAKVLKIEFGGVIPEDDNICKILNIGGERFNIKYASSKAFFVLAENIENGTQKMYDVKYKYKGIFGGIRSILKKNA